MTRFLPTTIACAIGLLYGQGAGAAAGASQNWASHPVKVYTTSEEGKRLALTDTLSFKAPGELHDADTLVIVSPNHRFQPMLGIGGAITDASAEVFGKLGAAKKAEFLKAYYDAKDGIGYSLARTTIHSSDFSSGSYTYIKEGDKSLSTFSIEHERAYRIPLIKGAIAAAGGKLTLFASPWSAPAFMKTNNDMLHGGSLRPEYADAWAHYMAKFVKAFEKEGIPVWGLTVQNEPMAKQTWESMIYTAEQERDFLKDHLGPVLHKEGLGDKKVIVWDHNRDMMALRANVIFDDPKASRYAWGMGFHWYETWAGGQPMYDNVAAVHQAHPDKHLLLTEATVEKFDPARFQYWPNGERYGSSIIHDLNNGAEGWTDWNILLDEHGGPNHVGNFCFAPIHADGTTGQLIFTPSYYYIGHFSKFIRPGARRVEAVSTRSVLQTTSFVNADGKLATVVMNESDKPVSYGFLVDQEMATVTIPAHAIQTLVL